MLNSKLWEQVNYTTPFLEYSGYITEYDLSKANISALYARGILSEEQYNDLYNSEKQYREITIGNMIRYDRTIYDEIAAGIKDAKMKLFDANNLTDNEIVAIHNDAVFVSGGRRLINEFGIYKFAIKNTYTHYLYLSNGMKFFYRYDKDTNEDIVDIKGISQEVLNLHPQPFVNFIITIQYMLTNCSILDLVEYYRKYLDDYINKKLPIENYRELNSGNAYKFNSPLFCYQIQEAQQSYVDMVDGSYNYSLLRDIGQIVYQRYFSQYR